MTNVRVRQRPGNRATTEGRVQSVGGGTNRQIFIITATWSAHRRNGWQAIRSAHLDARTIFPRRHSFLMPEVSIKIRNILKSARKADISYTEGFALKQCARPSDPNLANTVSEIVARHFFEVPREGRPVHSCDAGRS